MRTGFARKGLLFALAVILVAASADAQTAKRRRKITTRRKAVSARQSSGYGTGTGVINPATGNAVNPPGGTAENPFNSPAASLRPDNVFGALDSIKPSLRVDGAIVDTMDQDMAPLSYQYIRKDDAIWGKRIWREIDTREKMNLPFRYPANEDNGSQMFINILLNAIRKGEVTAFDPIDDRFTTPMSLDQLTMQLQGKVDTVLVTDPVTGKETQQVFRNDFDPNAVVRYRIKEDWVFDKQTSTMYVRIIGIAPEKAILNSDGSIRTYTPIFWLYYPDLRPVLARYEVYNPKNYAMRLSWEDLFEMRMFSSYIIKEDNVFDRSIKDYIHNGVRRLMEGQRIKNEIFDWEQNLWQY
ncbi:MAG TPA: gliding motility protein GldN [Chitinophagaceae bacterium]|nr:gliding motility protein GldN [Chitinophagaceae bacterium]